MRNDIVIIIICMAITLIGAIALPIWFADVNQIQVKDTLDSHVSYQDDLMVKANQSLENSDFSVADDLADGDLAEQGEQNIDPKNDIQEKPQDVIAETKQNEVDTDNGQNDQVYVSDQYVQQQIDANRDSISDSDLETGAPIFNKIDMNVVYALADDGFTEDEKVQLNNYLKSIYTEEEYNTASGLFYKYIGLVE